MKKIMLCFATCGLLLASCQQNEVLDVNSSDPNVIGFGATTTRTGINTLTEVQNGFDVYATKNVATTWYIGSSADNVYKFGPSTWDWATTTKHQWPGQTSEYPMNFYAYYPIGTEATNGGFVKNSNYPSLKATITVKTDPANQTDFLAANVLNVTTKPANSMLSLTFAHIMSKVNFGIIAGNNVTPYVQKLTVENVGNIGTYDYTLANNGDWETFTNTSLGDYVYFNDAATNFTSTGGPTETAAPFYAVGGHLKNLMLRPQTATPTSQVDITTRKITAPANNEFLKAYIGMVYRAEIGATDPNSVGYKERMSCPTNPKTGGAADNIYHRDYSGSDTKYEGALYIKVGFPFAATSFDWSKGKGYIYNIKLGTFDATGGYYVADTYFDNKGNDTGIPVDGDKQIGDPVATGQIDFVVLVENWDDTTPETSIK